MKPAIHRTINTVLLITVAILGLRELNEVSVNLYDELSGITESKTIESEIARIAEDEGYRACYYKDSLGLGTIGFGVLVKDEMKKGDCIDGHEAVSLLRKHYLIAKNSVERRYPWAKGKKKLVLINLSYNMGETRLSGFTETLKHFKNGDYDLAAGELLNSDYARQVPNRAGRMAGRIMELKGE